MKPNVLISGGTGSGGSFLAEWILQNHPEYNVVLTSRWHSTSNLSNIAAIKDKVILKECDLLDFSSIVRVLQECKPERVFHMAATANVHICFITPLAVIKNNIESTANLFEAVRLLCPETIFQLCSTSEIYGKPLYSPMNESHPTKPVNPYAVSKLAADSLGYAYYSAWGLKIITTRAFAYLNSRRHDLFATTFALQIARIEAGKQDVLLHGNLNSIRTVMSIYDMCEAYWVASERCQYGEAYNIGGRDVLSVGEFLEALKAQALVPIKSELDPKRLRPVDTDKQICDSTKFFQTTGWSPKISLEDGIKRLLNDCREIVKNEN